MSDDRMQKAPNKPGKPVPAQTKVPAPGGKKKITTDPCDGAQASQFCTDFMKDVVMEWRDWILRAANAYTDCCQKAGPKQPGVPTPDCKSMTDFEDLCELFRDWAKDVRKWAKDFGKDVDKCFSGWDPGVKVPGMPKGPCKDCGQFRTQVRVFHLLLAAWAEDVRYPLNEICTQPTPGRVPEPPPPPFE